MWNPYRELAPGTKRSLGVGAVLGVLLLWVGLTAPVVSGAPLVEHAKLPAPWAVMKAFGTLAWSEVDETVEGEAPVPETSLAGTLESGAAFTDCAQVCGEVLSAEVTDLECEVDWTEPDEPGGILWCQGRSQGQRSLLAEATAWSAGRVMMAGLLVVLFGLPLGVAMGASPRVNAALSPMVDPFRSAPIVAVLPVLVMWLGIGEASKLTFLFLGSVVYLIPMVRDAIQAVPQTYYISARDLGATPFEAVRHAVLPMALPRIADGVIVAVSVMWTYITVAEYVNAEVGLGQLISNARRFSAMDQVFVGLIVIIGLALLTYQAMVWLKRRLFPWEAA